MKRSYTAMLATGVLLLAIAAAFAATPVLHNWWKPAVAKTVVAKPKSRYTKAQEAILASMIRVCHHQNSLQAFYVNGHMDTHNPADSGNDVHADFVCSRRNQEYYYRVGDNEMVCLKDRYINISHDLKKIEVAPPQQLVTPAFMQDDALLKLWEGESYEVYADTLQNMVRIQLLCEHHASCKEFRLVYDTATQLPQQMYVRMTDLDDPLNKEKDKIYQVSVAQWQLTPVSRLFDASLYVSGNAKQPAPSARLAGYELSTAY